MLSHKCEQAHSINNIMVNKNNDDDDDNVTAAYRMDRLLRSAPQLLAQPPEVVERRLSLLRAVLGLTPSPELERVRGEKLPWKPGKRRESLLLLYRRTRFLFLCVWGASMDSAGHVAAVALPAPLPFACCTPCIDDRSCSVFFSVVARVFFFSLFSPLLAPCILIGIACSRIRQFLFSLPSSVFEVVLSPDGGNVGESLSRFLQSIGV